jgi:hypothetical protein
MMKLIIIVIDHSGDGYYYYCCSYKNLDDDFFAGIELEDRQRLGQKVNILLQEAYGRAEVCISCEYQ